MRVVMHCFFWFRNLGPQVWECKLGIFSIKDQIWADSGSVFSRQTFPYLETFPVCFISK